MILIVNGPCGVGKSSIARQLAPTLNESILIHGDDIHNCIINSEIVPEQLALTYKNIDALVCNFKQNGYKNIIVDYVYETEEHLNIVKKNFERYDDQVKSVLLKCELDENIRRDKLRNESDICGAKRVRELHNIFKKQANLLGVEIDITNRSINETIDYILKVIME